MEGPIHLVHESAKRVVDVYQSYPQRRDRVATPNLACQRADPYELQHMTEGDPASSARAPTMPPIMPPMQTPPRLRIRGRSPSPSIEND